MTTHTDAIKDYRFRSASNRMGLWLFILSDAFVFGGLLVSRFYLFGGERPELNQLLGLIVTTVLLLSSFFMNRAEIAASFGDQKGFLRNTLITILLGVLFPTLLMSAFVITRCGRADPHPAMTDLTTPLLCSIIRWVPVACPAHCPAA